MTIMFTLLAKSLNVLQIIHNDNNTF